MRDSPHRPPAVKRTSNLIITNSWDNFTMFGSGSVDLWKFGDKFYVSMDGINYEEESPDNETLAAMEGPFNDVTSALNDNAGSILSVGPGTQSVTSSIHTAPELRELLRVEPCLLEGNEDIDEWFIDLNGIKHRVDAKTLAITPVHGTKKRAR